MPAGVKTIPLAASTQVEPPVPTPRPMVIVDGGPAAINVIFIGPAWATVKLLKSLPPTGTVPMNVSVVRTIDGAVVEVLVPPLSQAAVSGSVAMRASETKRFIRIFEVLADAKRQPERLQWRYQEIAR